MRKPVSSSRIVCWLAKKTGSPADWPNGCTGLSLIVSLSLMIVLFSACSGPFGGSSSPTSTAPSTQSLNHIKWCDKPLMVFHDEGAFTPTPQTTATATAGTASTPAAGPGTPQTLTDWSVVKVKLGFTIYLPATLPNGTCLLSAQATIHDPTLGSSFFIGYLFPDHTSLSVSEAPLQAQNITFECSAQSTPAPTPGAKTATPAAPTVAPVQLCSGAKETTDIAILGSGTVQQLQQIFTNLQPDVNWIPAS